MFISKTEKNKLKQTVETNNSSINELVTLIRLLNNRINVIEKIVNNDKTGGWSPSQRLAQSKRMVKYWADKKETK
jgi:hypothetical protein